MLPSGSELLLIIVVAFILFGGKQVREFARSLGKITRKIQKASQDFQREINIDTPEENDENKKPDLKG